MIYPVSRVLIPIPVSKQFNGQYLRLIFEFQVDNLRQTNPFSAIASDFRSSLQCFLRVRPRSPRLSTLLGHIYITTTVISHCHGEHSVCCLQCGRGAECFSAAGERLAFCGVLLEFCFGGFAPRTLEFTVSRVVVPTFRLSRALHSTLAFASTRNSASCSVAIRESEDAIVP